MIKRTKTPNFGVFYLEQIGRFGVFAFKIAWLKLKCLILVKSSRLHTITPSPNPSLINPILDPNDKSTTRQSPQAP